MLQSMTAPNTLKCIIESIIDIILDHDLKVIRVDISLKIVGIASIYGGYVFS